MLEIHLPLFSLVSIWPLLIPSTFFSSLTFFEFVLHARFVFALIFLQQCYHIAGKAAVFYLLTRASRLLSIALFIFAKMFRQVEMRIWL